MTVFEYGSSIISIILGLAVAHLLGGLTAPLRLRSSSGTHWIFTAWCISTLFVVVGGWYAIWSILQDVETLYFFRFLPLLLVCCVIYGAARILVPDFHSNVLPDLRAHFESIRAPFLCCLAFVFGTGAAVMPVLNITAGGTAALLEIGSGVVLCALALAGAFVANPRFQAVLALAWPAIYLVQQGIQPAISAL